MHIAVYCGSSDDVAQPFLELAHETGRMIAARGHTLVYGGGRVGLMGRLSLGARQEGGRVLGVILDKFLEMGVGDPDIDEMEIVSDMRSRKKGLEDLAHAHLVLPGGIGTLDELFEILSLKYIDANKNPVVILDFDGFYEPIRQMLDKMIRGAFLKVQPGALYHFSSTPEEALVSLEKNRP